MPPLLIGIFWLASGCVGLVAAEAGTTARLVLLHTNDIHGHVRPGYDGVGGISYVSGYVRAQRSTQDNILVLDAGDVTEKGDLVAFRSGELVTYEAMRRIGYDAVTIGNHDNDAGLESLRRYEEALGQPLLCLNRVDATGTPLFEASRVIVVGAVRVGIIGMIVPQDEGTWSFETSGAALARASERLAPKVDLVVALCHEGAAKCARWSEMAPAVDLFVTGHEHGELDAPAQVEKTGAWLVQAGYYARAVGRAEIDVDLQSGRIARLRGEVVEMRHDRIPVDREMASWIQSEETRVCPEAGRHLFVNTERVDASDLACLAAEAMRRDAGEGAEIAFCHPGQVIRAGLPVGPVDVNAVFLVGGQRGHDNVVVRLTGAQILAYLEGLAGRGDPTQWAGFVASITIDASTRVTIDSSLVPTRTYRVLMPEVEWRTRLMRLVTRARERGQAGELARIDAQPEPSPVHFTDAMVRYMSELRARGMDFREAAEAIRQDHPVAAPGG